MRNSGKFVIISVESQKGGVGKTTAAFNIARMLLNSRREIKYQVLLLDLDISGTEAAIAGNSFAFVKQTEVLSFPIGATSSRNVVDLFSHYMCGNILPDVGWIKASEKKADGAITLTEGKINVASSYLSPTPTKSKTGLSYGPAVLFDETHSTWFLEMLQEIVEKATQQITDGKTLAVILDNSPGFTGLRPVIEEWLTDLGPDCGKFVFVNAMDPQDVVACVEAIYRINKLYEVKCKAARHYAEVVADIEPTEHLVDKSPEARFFARLASTCPDSGVECCWPAPKEHPNCTNCSLCFYRNKTKTPSENIKIEDSQWWGFFCNRVPKRLKNSEFKYEFNWETVKALLPSNDDKKTFDKILERCKRNFQAGHVSYMELYSYLYVANCLSEKTASRKGSQTKTSDSIALVLPDPPTAPNNHDDFLSYSHNIGAYLCHLEERFRESLNRVSTRYMKELDAFSIDWSSYSPLWRFSAFIFASVAKRSYDSAKFYSQSCDEISTSLHNAIDIYGREFIEPALLEIGSYVPNSLLVYTLAAYCVALSIRFPGIDQSKIAQRSKSEQFLAHRKRIERLLAISNALDPCVSHNVIVNQDLWLSLINDNQRVSEAAQSACNVHAFNGAGHRNEYISQNAAKNEYMNYANSQLVVWAANDDLVLLNEAVKSFIEADEAFIPTVVIKGILSETIVSRSIPCAEGMSLLKLLYPKHDEVLDPIVALQVIDVLKAFESALSPILKGWNLL